MAARVKNAENAMARATSGYLPTVAVGGAYQWNDHDQPLGSEGESYRVAAFLRWDLFNGGRRRSERARARHQVREAEELLEGLRKQAGFEVYRAYLAAEEARATLELARSREELAAEGVRIVGVRYENALSTVVELLDAQTALDQARAGAVAAANRYLTAVAELQFASGLILDAYLPESREEPTGDETGAYHAPDAVTGDSGDEK
jgi:outer membrane protein TolC